MDYKKKKENLKSEVLDFLVQLTDTGLKADSSREQMASH